MHDDEHDEHEEASYGGSSLVMSREDKIEAIRNAAEAVDGKVRPSYSGRGMFGRTCYGVSCQDASACIEETAALGVRGARQDSLGLRSIVYWPSVEGEPSGTDRD